MKTIRCAHCGNSHSSVAEVRNCSTVNPLAAEYEAPSYDSVPDEALEENKLPAPVSAMSVAQPLDLSKIYILEEKIYRLRMGKSGFAYAMEVSLDRDISDKYAPGIAKKLRPEDVIEIGVLKSIGKETGICLVCGRKLTNPTSVENGIGPICADGYA